MGFYNNTHQFVCGIDLDTQMMYACNIDTKNNIFVHENIGTKSQSAS